MANATEFGKQFGEAAKSIPLKKTVFKISGPLSETLPNIFSAQSLVVSRTRLIGVRLVLWKTESKRDLRTSATTITLAELAKYMANARPDLSALSTSAAGWAGLQCQAFAKTCSGFLRCRYCPVMFPTLAPNHIDTTTLHTQPHYTHNWKLNTYLNKYTRYLLLTALVLCLYLYIMYTQ